MGDTGVTARLLREADEQLLEARREAQSWRDFARDLIDNNEALLQARDGDVRFLGELLDRRERKILDLQEELRRLSTRYCELMERLEAQKG